MAHQTIWCAIIWSMPGQRAWAFSFSLHPEDRLSV